MLDAHELFFDPPLTPHELNQIGSSGGQGTSAAVAYARALARVVDMLLAGWNVHKVNAWGLLDAREDGGAGVELPRSYPMDGDDDHIVEGWEWVAPEPDDNGNYASAIVLSPWNLPPMPPPVEQREQREQEENFVN